MKGITPYLWFDSQAEEAARFYCSVFRNSRVVSVSYYGENMPMPAGTALVVEFELDGQAFAALNGGPVFHFTEAISFLVNCEDQAEVDRLWKNLTAGGEEQPCGWLKDRYGVSWQIVPTILAQLIGDPDPVKAARATQAMLKMKKLDIAALQRAHDGIEE